MKKMYVLDADGKKLFAGQRIECKRFIRANNVNHYTLSESYVEKVVVKPPVEEFDEEPDNDNNLAKPGNKEGFFNRIF